MSAATPSDEAESEPKQDLKGSPAIAAGSAAPLDGVVSVLRNLTGHNPLLDGVRGIAILLVLLHNFNPYADATGTVQKVVAVLVNSGWIGVQLFFVLSGYLITGALLETKESPNYWGTFFMRRVLRIFPLYYATLIAAFVVAPLVTGKQTEGSESQWLLWTYLVNWPKGVDHPLNPFPHYWSLAVEEQFYFVWPWVVRFLSKKQVAWVSFAMLFVALGIRIALLKTGTEPDQVYSWTICRVDGLTMGAGLAAVLRMPKAGAFLMEKRRVLGVAAVATFLLGFAITHGEARTSFISQTVGYATLSIAFTHLVFVAVVANKQKGGFSRMGSAILGFAPLRSLGKYSYGIYVFHMPLQLFVFLPLLKKIHPGEPDLVWGSIYLVGAIVATHLAAMISYYALEKPFLSLKKYFVAKNHNGAKEPAPTP